MGMPRAKLAVASIGSTIQTRPSPVASPPSSSPITRSSGKAAATCSRTMASIAVSAWVTGLRSALIRTRTSPRKTLIPIVGRAVGQPEGERQLVFEHDRSLPKRESAVRPVSAGGGTMSR